MHKIKVYGEIFPEQGDLVDGNYNLSMLSKELEKAGGDDLEIGIHSPGGDVDEGFAIYDAIRRYAAENNAKITTRADGQCSSIATIIFLAGDRRIASQNINAFVHSPWMISVGDSNEMKRSSDILEAANHRIAAFYAKHTDLSFEEAKELMAAETYLTPEEAVNIRFATEIEEVLRPAALRRPTSPTNKKDKSKNDRKMSKNKEKNFFDHVSKFFKNEGEGIKNIEVFTSTNDTLVFPDLEEGATPKVGDKAEIDGKAAEGRYTLQDGTVYVFVAGELTEIEQPEEENDDDAMDALKAENEKLKEQLTAQASQIEEIQNKQKERDKFYNMLKNAASKYNAEDKDNDEKTQASSTGKKRSLADAIANLSKN